MSDAKKTVHPQITDAVTQASSHVLGLGPATAAINAYLGQAQAQTILGANMIGQQQQQALVAMATTVNNVGKLMGLRRAARPAGGDSGAVQPAQAENYFAAGQPPVVT